jgi:hypothetical protein
MKALVLVMVGMLALGAPGQAALAEPDAGPDLVQVDGGAPVDAGPVDPPIQLVKGQPAPMPGWLLSDTRARLLVAHESDCQAALTAQGMSGGLPPGLVLAGVGGAAVGAAVAVVVMLAVHK